MILNFVFLFAGFALLIKGADILVDGSASLASIFKIPTIIVGLVIVSFGTSAPEAAVSITAGLNGSNAIALSNVVGSNIFNLLLVVGVSAIIIPLPVPRTIIKNELPMLVGITALVVTLGWFGLSFSRLDGLLLLGLIIFYLGWLVNGAIKNRAVIEVEEPGFSLSISILFILVGLFCIIFGGDLVVSNAQNIALKFGLSERLIGLTIVSVGTSLPELVTSVVAAKKGNVDIAVGNIVGSCIFNLLFILGSSAIITPILVDVSLLTDMAILMIATVLCYLFAKSKEKFDKQEGLFLTLIFILYMAFIIARN